jgi:hypothetical protein
MRSTTRDHSNPDSTTATTLRDTNTGYDVIPRVVDLARRHDVTYLMWHFTGLQIEGILAYFTRLKCQKRIGDDVGDLKYVFTKKKFLFVKMTRLICFIQLIMQEYYSKCLKMYLITLKVSKIC